MTSPDPRPFPQPAGTVHCVARAVLDSPQAARAARGRARFFPDATDAQWQDWRWQFRHRIHTLDQLLAVLPVAPPEAEALRGVLHEFRMGITPYYLSLVRSEEHTSEPSHSQQSRMPSSA